ncbi:hypothetical protein A2334_02540 [Candidatus Roizmanbacteria bacterium RIFOXYB2_FULL_38_10]|uniref:Thioredoxin-like fold domain-containing protein n=1 Tax=Candidatus Roizmanbacteria bacterium RIFOXYD1_FULL_38_12 TaxID=1802093 RepID=A0A1F7KZY4_9BACT|nr:MAG: hypothetical protein A3K47_01430 [Candidatus Roizmanbacteria bacterium RIFOXYA2_FULL_38_14]OGK63446.1 MAG: hypothetical protein A3K27_01430 [Candidatus Roizmanbacteria bacterium RIFOXYA1_FULL_37_12]OGK65292.1 MAG: hypothetical protein A3K38_01430 [Candidatus Roizmanbacteria bacterium RIFOXYB1_FULL_40_23]OGK67994.1 MAG: hypothetical protein A2334_02540 [Candidatus Roizmanbacteria bacterium RIFOXYB2_FULL_38_10]OGK69697.1 MAG: hypothetical protein A3K21_01435 [Candidatus Roizmanbacteria ba
MKKIHTSHNQSPEVEKNLPGNVQLNNNWKPLAFIAGLIAVFLVLRFVKGSGPDINKMKTQIIPEAVKKVINNPSTKVSILNVKEASGLVEFQLEVAGQKYTSYISRDGKILFTSGIKVDELSKSQQPAKETKKLTCDDVPKTDKASLTAYVVADCPFGLQMQRVFKKALNEAPDLSSYLNIKYIGSVENGKITSMHGDKEAQENLKQICIREEQKEKYWPYVSCYMMEGKTDECLITTGVDTSELTACTGDANRGLKYAQADFTLANKYGVSGSPTLISNEKQTVSEFDFGGRTPDAIKQLVCCGSKEKPGFCASELSKADIAVSLSKTDEAAEGSGTTTSAAGCAPAN